MNDNQEQGLQQAGGLFEKLATWFNIGLFQQLSGFHLQTTSGGGVTHKDEEDASETKAL